MMTSAEELTERRTTSSVTCKTIVTTLYDVIAALNAQVLPEEDDAVTAAVLYLCERGHLRWLPHRGSNELFCA